jgi:hypothetical protein
MKPNKFSISRSDTIPLFITYAYCISISSLIIVQMQELFVNPAIAGFIHMSVLTSLLVLFRIYQMPNLSF